MKSKDYYSRYDHFLRLDLSKVESFQTIKNWLKGKKKVVDVGCGVGHLASFWGAVGIDNDLEAIKIGKKRFPKTKFILNDVIRKLPFKKNSIDAIVCYNVLEHLPDDGRERFFDEAKRILKKDGIFIAGYIDEDYWFNHLLAFLIPDYGIKDPTHLVSWKVSDFKKEVSKYFKIVKEKRTSPYGKLTFITCFLKGEVIILARKIALFR